MRFCLLQAVAGGLMGGRIVGRSRHRRPPLRPAPQCRRDAIIPVLDQFQRDIIRMIATLFGPMLVGAIIIPLLMMIFSWLGYQY